MKGLLASGDIEDECVTSEDVIHGVSEEKVIIVTSVLAFRLLLQLTELVLGVVDLLGVVITRPTLRNKDNRNRLGCRWNTACCSIQLGHILLVQENNK